MNRQYVLISPGRNEAQYMRQTLDSVIAQTVRPACWVIVDDGSTDETPAILAEYAARHDWIRVVTRTDRGRRAVGPGVIEAFYAGYETINPNDFDYLCKLDLDLILPAGYFEELMRRMEADSRIATCSGKSYIIRDGKFISERHGDETSIGATKFYRRDRFQELGGFVREVGWDGIDVHRCRMMGWQACSWDVPELRFTHLRQQGTSHKGALTGRMRQGHGQYFMGTRPIYMLATSVYRLNEKPYLLASAAMFWGYVWSAIRRKPRYENLEFRRFLQRWQLRALLVGKKRAVAEVLLQRATVTDANAAPPRKIEPTSDPGAPG
ncbi:glycosyltransferase family 2 protein [Piscinibacter sp.]|jgi:biofilm PGA synthesis N-glycosyltransferase PgaC|uniref:glycosyltransferase family 2 protein n=1 Tax=Piscinibacter sp. TaxID=1903157 RepID=UPI0035597A51